MRIEVHEQSDVQASCPQVGQHLRLEDLMKMLDAFHLDDDLPLHDEVDLVGAHPMALVLNRDRHLTLERDVLFQEFDGERFLVGRLTQLWTEDSMHGDRTANHSSCNRGLILHSSKSSQTSRQSRAASV